MTSTDATITDDGRPSLDPAGSDPRGGVATIDRPAVALPAFRRLMALKRRTIIPMTVFYVAAYLGTMLLMGFARPLMTTKIAGPLTTGYALVLALYAMCWVMAVLYALAASLWFDPAAREARAAAVVAR